VAAPPGTSRANWRKERRRHSPRVPLPPPLSPGKTLPQENAPPRARTVIPHAAKTKRDRARQGESPAVNHRIDAVPHCAPAARPATPPPDPLSPGGRDSGLASMQESRWAAPVAARGGPREVLLQTWFRVAGGPLAYVGVMEARHVPGTSTPTDTPLRWSLSARCKLSVTSLIASASERSRPNTKSMSWVHATISSPS
jgi:hypothetical protein